jgi:hypothetical protein
MSNFEVAAELSSLLRFDIQHSTFDISGYWLVRLMLESLSKEQRPALAPVFKAAYCKAGS